MLERYEEILVTLSPKELAVVALLLEDLQEGDVAELFGIPKATVNSRLCYARKKLRNRMPKLDTEGRTRLRGTVYFHKEKK